MENQSLSKVSSKCHLPEELCLDIISRLPVKSLVRFRCVSKSWLSMITHPDFCHLHLKNFSNNHNESHLLVVHGRSQHCVVRCSDTFESTETLFTLRSLPHSHGEGSWNIKYSANGLFLLGKRSGRDYFKVLCNPSIRKFRDIPPSPNSSFKEADIGLGYDPSGKDYKYVKLIHENPNIPPMVAIYTLGPDSWKIIPFQGKGFSKFEWKFESIRYLNMTVYLQGILYFLAIRVESDVWELVSFDLTREVFDFIDLPEDAAHYISRRYFYNWVKLVSYGCSTLAVFVFGDCMSMWVLEIESMCWTVPYSLMSLDFNAQEFLYLKKNRDILLWWSKETTSFSLATGNRLEQWQCSLVSSYNLQTRKEKILMMQKQNDDFQIENVYGYIESMALLK